MKYDITVSENKIGGRQGWAYVCNSDEVTVLKVDLDKPQEYKDYRKYGDVRVPWKYCGRENYQVCTLAWNSCYDEPYWELSSGGCCISSSFGYHDAMELLNNSQAPIVRADKVIALAKYSSERVSLSLYKLGKVDIHCSTTAKLIPLNDEEMSEVVKNINKWLNS